MGLLRSALGNVCDDCPHVLAYVDEVTMTLLDIVVALLMTQSPFGPVNFAATPDGPDHVIVEFMNPEPHVVLRFDEGLDYEIIEGKIIECQPEKSTNSET